MCWFALYFNTIHLFCLWCGLSTIYGVINMCGNMELAEERLDLIESEVAKHFGFADTEYKKLMIWTK